jgi:hypothetical protein
MLVWKAMPSMTLMMSTILREVAAGDLRHDLGRILRIAAKLPDHRAQHAPGHGRDHQHQGAADGQQDHGVAPEGLVDVVDVVAKADDPVPRREPDDGVQLVDLFLGAGMAPSRNHHLY